MTKIDARRLFNAALPGVRDLAWARPRSYAILGCVAALEDPVSAVPAADHLERMASELEASMRRAAWAHPDWPWPEERCTYDNGALPEALIAAGLALGRPATIDLGLEVLGWLVAAETAPGGWIRPIGNRGWWSRGSVPAKWDQQPIEPASIVSAAAAAWDATHDDHWAVTAERALGWFLGANDRSNPNQGAESTLAWLFSVERVRELRQRRSATLRCSGRGHERTYATRSERVAVASAIAVSAAP